MADINDILAEITPVTRAVRIVTRGDLGAEIDRLEAELRQALADDEQAKKNDGLESTSRAPEIAQQILDAQEAAAQHEREFVFADVGAWKWSNLLSEHPPTAEQKRLGMAYDEESFQTAAIAASCQSPKMSEEDARKLQERLSAGRWEQLWVACLAVNRGVGGRPKSASASSVLNGSGPRSAPVSD